MSEVALGLAYLTSTLSGDSTLTGYAPGGVHRKVAPPSAVTPFMTIRYLPGGRDAPVFGGGRAYSDLLYEVKVCGPASNTATLVSAAKQIDEIITTANPVSVTGGTIKACFRDQPIQDDEEPDGAQWSCFGGVYRMFITA
jgi:hypothetical protein